MMCVLVVKLRQSGVVRKPIRVLVHAGKTIYVTRQNRRQYVIGDAVYDRGLKYNVVTCDTT